MNSRQQGSSSVREVPSKSRDYLGSILPMLNKPATKICVLIFYTALFVVGGAALAPSKIKITVNFDETEMTMNRFTAAIDKYYEEETAGLLFSGDLCYHDQFLLPAATGRSLHHRW